MSGLFGGLFDFNRDGKTDIFETALGLSIIDQAAREEEEARRREAEADDFWFFTMADAELLPAPDLSTRYFRPSVPAGISARF